MNKRTFIQKGRRLGATDFRQSIVCGHRGAIIASRREKIWQYVAGRYVVRGTRKVYLGMLCAGTCYMSGT